MIIDTLENADLYARIHPHFADAFAFLKNYTFLPDGTYELRGRDVFANVSNSFRTRQTEEIRLEAHREYIDIQCVLRGREELAAAPIGPLTEETPYDPQEDIAFYRGESSRLLLSDGMFAVFFPQDGHMGGIAVGNPREEVRVVIKVRISPT